MGGERSEPNPLFLAHAAGLTELYALLSSQAQSLGLTLRSFVREEKAREPFKANGRERALAPDALITLEDENERALLAFVELDLGTMGRPRLRLKASGYAAYAVGASWSERHRFCPCLLFLTTTERRAVNFLKTLREQIARGDEGYAWYFRAGACAMAHTSARALTEPCWDDLSLAGGGRTLRQLLEAGREPYERALARKERKRQEREEKLHLLQRDPYALREYLRERLRVRGFTPSTLLEPFEADAKMVLKEIIEHDDPLDQVQREALLSLGRSLGDRLVDSGREQPAEPAAPDAETAAAIKRLVEHERRRQQELLRALAVRHGSGPKLRALADKLEAGKLLNRSEERSAERGAREDAEAADCQRILQVAYEERREREARRLARQASPWPWLQDPEPYYERVDRGWLRCCSGCRRFVFPHPDEQMDGYGRRHHAPERRCEFCGSAALSPYEPTERPAPPPPSSWQRFIDWCAGVTR